MLIYWGDILSSDPQKESPGRPCLKGEDCDENTVVLKGLTIIYLIPRKNLLIWLVWKSKILRLFYWRYIMSLDFQKEFPDMIGLKVKDSEENTAVLKWLALPLSSEKISRYDWFDGSFYCAEHSCTEDNSAPESISRYDWFVGSRYWGCFIEGTRCHLIPRQNLKIWLKIMWRTQLYWNNLLSLYPQKNLLIWIIWWFKIVRRTQLYWREFIRRKNLQIWQVWRFKKLYRRNLIPR